MRLGVVIYGAGAYAAATIGALEALERRQIEPYAVCGIHMGAWVAAQYVCGGDVQQMRAALPHASRVARSLAKPQGSVRALLCGRSRCLCSASGIVRLLHMIPSDQPLGLCRRRGVFPCVMPNGRNVVFSTQAYAYDTDVSMTMQATLGFAARAAMACPPFVSPMPWLGAPLFAQESAAFAAAQLMRLGADRVLIVRPRAVPAHDMDAMELVCAMGRREETLPADTAELPLLMPADTGALSFRHMERMAQAGKEAAERQLDDVLGSLGMMQCRVLSFRERALAISRRK